MSRRMDKINSILHSLISQFLEQKRNLFLPDFLTVKNVEATNDLKKANVWVSVFSQEKKKEVILEKLEKVRRDLQEFIGEKITFKFNPIIKFEIDYSGESAQKIEEILQKIKENK